MSTRNVHPLVRDLYKRALTIGADYPTGVPHVRKTWKKALRNPDSWTPQYTAPGGALTDESDRELKKAIGKGRFMLREMVGVIQLKKYRAMKKRYEVEKNASEKPSIEEQIKDFTGEK